MDLVFFLFDLATLIALVSIVFVDEDNYYIVKFVIATLIILSMIYNFAFVCHCIRRGLGQLKCPTLGTAKPKGTQMKELVAQPSKTSLITRENIRGFAGMRD